MKLKFKPQEFQEKAVNALCDCFKGQPFASSSRFLRDPGKVSSDEIQLEEIGFKNAEVTLNGEQLRTNLKRVQIRNHLPTAPWATLNERPAFTVEMETGTGKTYVYIKTMFELQKRFGWTKFIVIVPSVAIREGVLKTFQITADHFADDYRKKARFFVYNSARLNELEQFANDSGINVMIINTQAFAARGADARRIDMKLDSFRSRKPIDVVAAVRPIVLIDEPQSVLGTEKSANVTRESVRKFRPLFYVTYSATHREPFNRIYRLDAIDAYQEKLVKEIKVIGISVRGSTGTGGYLYLQGITTYADKAPSATVVFDCAREKGVSKKIARLKCGDNIYALSGELEAYKNGFVVSSIDANTGTVEFIGGLRISVGSFIGAEGKTELPRIQIRETIKCHLQKERDLFRKRIKTLSLFFIDEVAKYRASNDADDKQNQERLGFYAKTFEEEYRLEVEHFLNELPFGEEKDFRDYLKGTLNNPEDVHAGYFSGDKKGKFVNSTEKRGEGGSDDISAYDLIMRNKERLLSFEEPVRFIFSHSALREGWDNPNVFQICTMRDANSDISKRQSIGRGLRLCVDANGDRQDAEKLGKHAVQEVNELTVIANESFEDFSRALQTEYEDVLQGRPKEITNKLFKGLFVVDDAKNAHEITSEEADEIYVVLKQNKLLEDKQLSTTYQQLTETERKTRVETALPEELKPYTKNLIAVMEAVFAGKKIPVSDSRKKATLHLDKTKFASKEFKELWKRISAKSFYTVDFDEGKFIEKAVDSLDRNLTVTQLRIQITEGRMQTSGESVTFKAENEDLSSYLATTTSSVKYDLIGELTDKTGLTRKCVGSILGKIRSGTFAKFKQNPEEFIVRAAKLINEQKASVIIEHITYNKLSDTWSEEAVFSEAQISGEYGTNVFDRTGDNGEHLPLRKHLFDKLRYDSAVEKTLAERLDIAAEVELYIKLPGGFYIHTPLGKYNPDWAISFKENGVKHIYFVAETKGDISDLQLKGMENAKIECARRHFAAISNSEVRYDVVESFETLLAKIRK